MTNVNPILNNTSSGELSPKVYGRSDLAAYFNGLRRMENWIAQTQGGSIYRGGFQFVAETKGNQRAFLRRFQFSNIQAYALEFTDKNIRVYKDRGIITGPIDIVTPYLESEMFKLKFAQNAQDLYITHPNHQPRKLTRTSDTVWTLIIHAPVGIIPPFNSQSITSITQANPAVVTYSGADNFANGDNIRIDNVVGMTEVNESAFVVANVNVGANTFELQGTDSTGFAAYISGGNVYILDNCPSAAGIYEQRLIYGGSPANPETLWFSKSADFDDFTIGTGATDGLKYTVAVGEDANNIEWIKGTEDFLVIGGIGDILRATGGEGQTAISPDQISIKPTNTFGVSDINPIGKRQTLLYMHRNNRTLLSYEKDDLGIYKPIDNNAASDHITLSGVTQIAYLEGRPDIIWAVRNDGILIGMTIDRKQQVSGWHRHMTTGDFISITTTPRENDYDTLWVCVKRTVDGSVRYHIEFLNDNPEFPRREDFVTGTNNETIDGAVFQRALSEAQKTYIHMDNAATFNGAQRAVDAGANLTIGAVTGSGIAFTSSAAIFTAGDVGNKIWVKSTDGLRFGRATIVTFNSSTNVDCDITQDFDSTTIYLADAWYITASIITGLNNLEGLTVAIVADGGVHPERTVSGNQITLETEASVVHVGLAFTGTLETMDLEGGGTTGTVQTKKKSVYKVGVRLLDTLGLRLGTDYYRLDNRLVRQAIDLMDNPPPLFTGDEVVQFEDGASDDAGWARSKRIIIQQHLPLPASVQLITPYYTVSNA